MSKNADITVVVTSCNRHDLLERTLASFVQHETEHRVARILVAEDGDADPGPVCKKFGAEHFIAGKRLGQVALIDAAYATVETPYIFHLEDDWEFFRPGFMEKSRALLERDPKLITVQLRHWNADEKLTYIAPDGSWALVDPAPDTAWHGFSFNPSLRRLSDYKLLGSFSKQRLTVPLIPMVASAALPYEAEASEFYFRRGFYAAILDRPGYYRHIGEERHVTHGDDFTSIPVSLPRNVLCPCGSGQRFKHCHGKL
ncbi:MAG TPA: SEC-C metal-binding domain-containing protein [Rhizomicrobium sp.]|nr:SEC-C metal-binding domain-containing protein [Rhizomicrobium sp.]